MENIRVIQVATNSYLGSHRRCQSINYLKILVSSSWTSLASEQQSLSIKITVRPAETVQTGRAKSNRVIKQNDQSLINYYWNQTHNSSCEAKFSDCCPPKCVYPYCFYTGFMKRFLCLPSTDCLKRNEMNNRFRFLHHITSNYCQVWQWIKVASNTTADYGIYVHPKWHHDVQKHHLVLISIKLPCLGQDVTSPWK